MVWTRNDQKTNPASGQGGAWIPYGWIATPTRWPLDHAAFLPVGLFMKCCRVFPLAFSLTYPVFRKFKNEVRAFYVSSWKFKKIE